MPLRNPSSLPFRRTNMPSRVKTRLKYADDGGVYNMGRNIGIKVIVPIAL